MVENRAHLSMLIVRQPLREDQLPHVKEKKFVELC